MYVTENSGVPRGVNKDHVRGRVKVITDGKSEKWIWRGRRFFAGQCRSRKFYICSRNAPLHTARHILSHNPAVNIAKDKNARAGARDSEMHLPPSPTHSGGNELSKCHASERELYDSMACTALFVPSCKLSHIDATDIASRT